MKDILNRFTIIVHCKQASIWEDETMSPGSTS